MGFLKDCLYLVLCLIIVGIVSSMVFFGIPILLYYLIGGTTGGVIGVLFGVIMFFVLICLGMSGPPTNGGYHQ